MNIPNINEIRKITQEHNEQDVLCYMDKIRTAISNGIQQDARNGYYKHLHSWTDLGKTNLTSRASDNFKEALIRIQQEFQNAGYGFEILYAAHHENDVIDMVEIRW